MGSTELRDMIRTGWAEMTEDEKAGYLARAMEQTSGAGKVTKAAIKKVGSGRICFSFCPNSLCLIPHNQPIMLG